MRRLAIGAVVQVVGGLWWTRERLTTSSKAVPGEPAPRDPSCATPVVPAALVDAWADVDTPEEWERLARGAQPRAAGRLRER
jgi:hypothetical protein